MCKENKEENCNCRETEKDLALSYYSEMDGNTYRLPIINKEEPNAEACPLPDGSEVAYGAGLITSLFTGPRAFMYFMEEDARGVLTEVELLEEDNEVVTRHINIFTLTSWTRFDCDPNTYITDLGEEVHYCLHNDEPDYEGKIVKIIDPYGEVTDFSDVR
jgi:hypothetical protein